MQELETIEGTPTAASSNQAKPDVTSADECVPLLGVTTFDETTADPSEHSQKQPPSSGRLHGSLMQHHTHFEHQFEARSPPSSQPHHQTELLVEPQTHHQTKGSLQHTVSVPQLSQHSMSVPQQGHNTPLQPSLGQPQQPSFTAVSSQEAAGGHQSNASTGSLQKGAAMAHESWVGLEGGGGSGRGNGRAQAAVAAVHGLTCERPDGKLLFQDVSFLVHPGQLLKLIAVAGFLQVADVS